MSEHKLKEKMILSQAEERRIAQSIWEKFELENKRENHCGNCKWFWKGPTMPDFSYVRECRRNPPVAFPTDRGPSSFFPPVKDDGTWYCGEWAAK